MKYATIAKGDETVLGRLTGSATEIQLLADKQGTPLSSLHDLIDLDHDPEPFGGTVPLNKARIRAPIPRPRRNIFCVGKNYADHAKEFTGSGFDSGRSQEAVPTSPIVFSKVPECVIGHHDPIKIDPQVSACIDYEAELCVIIGREGRGISTRDAMDFVWGYTIVNDVTARDLQKSHSQWLIAKSQDSFCPMGPIAVTRDEIDLENTSLQCSVNGEIRQSANTADLIFDVPTLISVLSAGITLYPGDLIATGTPAGVGIGFMPPKYLKCGDVIRVEIDSIGVLENEVVDVET